jgi:hypothetical protein
MDWIMELFFPRDIVQTIDLSGLSGLETQSAMLDNHPQKSA